MAHNGSKIVTEYPQLDPLYLNRMKHAQSYHPFWWDRIDANGYLTDTKGWYTPGSNTVGFPVEGHPLYPRLLVPWLRADRYSRNYTLFGKGRGVIHIDAAGNHWFTIGTGPTWVTPGNNITVPTDSDGRWEVNFTMPAGTSIGWSFIHFFTREQNSYPGGDYINDFALVNEEHVEDYRAGKIFVPEVIERYRHFGVIRMTATILMHGGPSSPSDPWPLAKKSYRTWTEQVFTEHCLRPQPIPGKTLNYSAAPVPPGGKTFTGKSGQQYLVAFPHVAQWWLNTTGYRWLGSGRAQWRVVPGFYTIPGWQITDMTSSHENYIEGPRQTYYNGAWVALRNYVSDAVWVNAGSRNGHQVENAEVVDGHSVLTINHFITQPASGWTSTEWITPPQSVNIAPPQFLRVGDESEPFVRAGGQCDLTVTKNGRDAGGWAISDAERQLIPEYTLCSYSGALGVYYTEGCSIPNAQARASTLGPPPEVFLDFCKECNAHPMFFMSYAAMQSNDFAAPANTMGIDTASQRYIPTKDSIGPYVRDVALLCKQQLAGTGLKPIFEGAYEIGDGIWFSTQSAWFVEQRSLGGDARSSLFNGVTVSLIGQILAEVYGKSQSQVHTQDDYMVILYLGAMAYLHRPDWSLDQVRHTWGLNNASNRPWVNSLDSPTLWATHVGVQVSVGGGYFPFHTETWTRVNAMAATFEAGDESVVEHIIETFDPEEWSPTKQYHGMRQNGTGDVVYLPSGAGWSPRMFLCLADSLGSAPGGSNWLQLRDEWGAPWATSLPAFKGRNNILKNLLYQFAPNLRFAVFQCNLYFGWPSGVSNSVRNLFNAVIRHPHMKDLQLEILRVLDEADADLVAISALAGSESNQDLLSSGVWFSRVLPFGLDEDTPRWDAIIEYNANPVKRPHL